ncbi:hypothetical protein [Marinisporobacter balticus]|uniref:DRTGG domain-containing protein n=1 Tax=Marinisporobacter balticus TaxID=2018667 RepID=A0A4R2KNC0_9FIRM|nr:hypothetical protein [Marinisporobacter balticus]TCO72289.1 hypothetical protein EV214_11840 [Marinisporobacter balticus]
MKLSEIIAILSAKSYTNNVDLNLSIASCRASDLLSDVLRNPIDNSILLTGLINTQVIRTAEIMDILVIVFVRNKKPSKEIMQLALNNDIILLGTEYKLYECCGLLYSHGLRS